MLAPHGIRLLAVVFSLLAVPAALAQEWIWGMDVSALPVHEAGGANYRREGRSGDALTLLREGGVNLFRLRLFVRPNYQDTVTNDLAYTVALAKRVRASGAAFMLNIHYSDTWADPAKQYKPAAWEHLSVAELTEQVEDYTEEVLRAFVAADCLPAYVQIGNEITGGMLWPEGRVAHAPGLTAEETAARWQVLGGFLRAGVRGVEKATVGLTPPKIILHIESTAQPERTVWFFQAAAAAGVRFDVAALSYYPEWHGKLGQLQETLERVAAAIPQPLLVVETAYAAEATADWKGKPNMEFPLTPEGQRDFVRGVAAAVRRLPPGRGLGVCYWYPESVLTSGIHVWYGGTCALFDPQGEVRPLLQVVP